MYRRIIFTIAILSFVAFSDYGYSEISSKIKHYIKAKNIWISEKEIVVNFHGNLIKVGSIFKDNKGLFFLRDSSQGVEQYECPEGHPSVFGDGLCNQPDCPYFRN